jgi:hypothetical protein
MILTNKLLLPILLSFPEARSGTTRFAGHETMGDALWRRLAVIATPRVALAVLAVGCLCCAAGGRKAREQVIGDLGRGVPELKADARYNQDVEVDREELRDRRRRAAGDRAGRRAGRVHALRDARRDRPLRVPHAPDRRRAVGARLGGFTKLAAVGYSEGDVKWAAIPDTREQRNQSVMFSTRAAATS